eukprot:165914-Pelagomonas_calceolata.AAC.1
MKSYLGAPMQGANNSRQFMTRLSPSGSFPFLNDALDSYIRILKDQGCITLFCAGGIIGMRANIKWLGVYLVDACTERLYPNTIQGTAASQIQFAD